jgi:hypothetical protein
MTNAAVVILTEPARCELADVDSLVQAVLQVRQLNEAGLAPAQAFCDHPAAAMKFIEAYAKAYPELQLRSGDLPPPEVLYSIVADGGVRPLQAPAAPEAPKLGEASQLYPLYILSLGSPEALMRALQHNSFAKRDIQIVEIAPVEPSSAGSMPVAEAVAHEPISRSSWRAENVTEPEADDAAASAELAPSDPVKLTSVEVNLDHIKVDEKKDHDRSDEAFDQPAIVLTAPAAGSPGDAGSGLHNSTGSAAVASAAPPASAGQTVVLGTAAAPLSNPSPNATAAVPPGAEGEGLDNTSQGDVANPCEAAGAVDPGAHSAASSDPTESGACSGGSPQPAPDDAAPPMIVDAVAVTGSRAGTGAASEEPSNTCGRSFIDWGGDVLYPPNGSFVMEADVSYLPPADPGPGSVPFDDFFGSSGDHDVVDLEALCRGLSYPAPGGLDLELVGARAPAHAGLQETGEPSPQPDTCTTPYSGTPESGEDDTPHERLPASHDLDI